MSVFFSKYLPISPFTPKMPVFQTHTHTSQHVSTNHQVFCAEWLASVKRLMIWLSSLLGSSCAWSFRSEHDGDHRWKIHGFGETTTNPQFSRAGRWFLEETWWLWDFCLVDILMDSIHLVSALWRQSFLVSLFLGWRFAGPAFNPWTTLMSQKCIPFSFPICSCFRWTMLAFRGFTSYKSFHKG